LVALIVTRPDAALRFDPVSRPELDIERPAADKTAAPPVTSHVTFFPSACICWEKDAPTDIEKNVPVVIVGAGLNKPFVNKTSRKLSDPEELDALMTARTEVTSVGVPVISPVALFSTNGEISPDTIDQVIGPLPVALSVVEYGDNSNAGGNVRVVITGAPAALTVRTSALESAPCAFVAVNVILPEAVAVGVPDKTPAVLNVMPVGSVPAVTLHVIGVEPLAVNVVDG